jgi:SNF2 family DNA or RNA helicase
MRQTDFKALQASTVENFRLEISRCRDTLNHESARKLLVDFSSRVYRVDRLNVPRETIHGIMDDFRRHLQGLVSPVKKAYGVVQPPHMKVTLYGHQLVAIREMEEFERLFQRRVGNVVVTSRVGVLGDKVGSGKTFELLGLIIRDRMKFETPFFTDYHYSHVNTVGNISIQPGVLYKSIPASLVTCSRSIIKQWEASLNQTDLKWITVSTEGMFVSIEPGDFDVVIIATDLVNSYVDYWNEHAWKRLIYDEPDSARISSMKRVVAGMTWLVSATSEMIQEEADSLRHAHYLRALFSSAMGASDVQTFLNYIMIRTSEDFIYKSMNLPDYARRVIRIKPPSDVGILQGILDPAIMVQINAGDFKGAIKALGGGEEATLVDSAKRSLQAKIEDAEAKRDEHKAGLPNPRHEQKIIEWNHKIERYQAQLEEIEARIENSLREDCSVCLGSIRDPTRLPCFHVFCGGCILNIAKAAAEDDMPKCPVCRSSFEMKSVALVVKDATPVPKKETFSTKVEAAFDIISKGHKVIVFSEHRQSFENLRDMLTENKIEFSHLDGSRSDRERDLERYRNGNLNVLMLVSRINGSGLNLQNTQKIVILHATNPLLKKQLVGRAHRIGYKGGLEVVDILYDDEESLQIEDGPVGMEDD